MTHVSAAAASGADFYRSVWRWHFYAGLIVLPFLMILAVTGALYLFRDEIDALVHADLKRVAASQAQELPASTLVANALVIAPGTATKIVTPARRDTSAEVQIAAAGGTAMSAYVDPYSGRVLGTMPQDGTVMALIRQIHSLAFFGPVANAAIEIAAGWAVLLVASGVYLWWPRGERGGVVSLRGLPRQRTWWRDLHAVTGAFAGVFVVFLALSGMPWSIVWGAQFGGFVDAKNLGVPAGVWHNVPKSGAQLAELGHAAWTVERASVPVSAPVPAPGSAFGLDAAMEKVRGLGIAPGFAMALPTKPDGVFTASVFPDDVAQQRVIHLDRYSGAVLQDVAYAHYGPVGKAVEWGISVHMGQEFGLANQLVMLAACLAIVMLCVSAAVMWWKRRPAGALGVPPLPHDRRKLRIVACMLVAGSTLFPLTGASFLVMLLIDRAAGRFRLAR